MRRGTAIGGVAVLLLLAGCGDDDDGRSASASSTTTAAPTTTEQRRASLADVCGELSGGFDDVRSALGDLGSLGDLGDLDDALADAVGRVEDAARQLDDVEARDEDEEAVVDALDRAATAAGRIDDELADGDLGAAREELGSAGDAVDDARQRAADLDIDCSP